MDLICENYFEKKYERRIESFEKETLLGIFEIIDKMHKHSIEDYKYAIEGYLTEEDDEQIRSDLDFEKIYSEQFHSMFEHIAEEFKWRLKDLKSELEKRLDIRYKNESNNESDNESEDESEDESKKKFMENLTKFNPNLVFDVKSGKIINLKSDKKLQVITEENESENESESEIDLSINI